MSPEERFRHHVDNSENLELGHWYSRRNQKILAYQLAKELVVDGMEPEEAIEFSKEFIELFYEKAMRVGSW